MNKFLVAIKKIIPLKIFKAIQPIYHFLLAWVAAFFYGFPSKSLIVIGITGTTGKTTSVYLLAKMLNANGYKTGYTSTAMYNDGQKEWLNDKKMTMAGRFFTQKMLRAMVKNKCCFAIVETTSEGIKQFRHRFINYDILVFTGLYPEHIESHGGFENYKQAKGLLFAHLKRCRTKYSNDNYKVQRTVSGLKKTELKRIKKTIIANFADEHADYFLNFWAEKKIAYFEKKANFNKANPDNVELFNYEIKEINNQGSIFEIKGEKYKLKLMGEFNIANAMNAYAVVKSLDFADDKIRLGFEEMDNVPGRLEKIDMGQSFTVIVDYAYEPEAVAKLYEALKLIKINKIIQVLGSCGGGRDESRRPLLGKLAGEKADFVIVTNEDPYDDDPNIIIDQVALGAEHVGKKLDKNLFKILDRRDAIKKAFALAKEGDVVLITGKGSEQAICLANGEKMKWDDREIAKKELRRGK